MEKVTVSVDLLKERPVNDNAVGGTVLELMAARSQLERPIIIPIEASGPPPTAPFPMQTHTMSGEGQAQMSDDSQTDHLYE